MKQYNTCLMKTVNKMTQVYTYVTLKKSVFDVKDEQKTIPMLEFENSWVFRLETLQKYNELFLTNIITSGSFYPRLKTSSQKGHRAWNEIKRIHFKDTENIIYDIKYLDSLLKRRRRPIIYFDSICYFDWDTAVDETLNADELEFKYLEVSTEVPIPKKMDINIPQQNEKLKVVLDYIKEMLFSHAETLSLIILLAESLI